jgi:hypothetical protein
VVRSNRNNKALRAVERSVIRGGGEMLGGWRGGCREEREIDTSLFLGVTAIGTTPSPVSNRICCFTYHFTVSDDMSRPLQK